MKTLLFALALATVLSGCHPAKLGEWDADKIRGRCDQLAEIIALREMLDQPGSGSKIDLKRKHELSNSCMLAAVARGGMPSCD